MADLLHTLAFVVGLATITGACGASFAFGVATVCRRMNWAPVNINIYNHKGDLDA